MTPNSLIKPITITLMLAVVTLSIFTVQAAVKVGSYVGNWKPSITYAVGDLITYSNKTFISLVAKNKAKDPLKNPKVWQLLAGVGADGVDGAIGSQGDIGSKGDTGLQGPIGLTGPSGTNGVDGVVGPKGDAGIPTVGTDVGDMQYWDGSQWVMIPVATNNTVLRNCNGVPTWVADHCALQIGDTGPAGGIVFYISDAGLHGLEAATMDQGIAAWGCYGISIVGTQVASVGAGAANTAAILAGCNEANTAAKVANAYALNGFTDWYLPSKNELYFLYAQKNVVGGFSYNSYWSSTETYSTEASYHTFSYGTSITTKESTHSVRAVRSF
jgi:hypothetical protein